MSLWKIRGVDFQSLEGSLQPAEDYFGRIHYEGQGSVYGAAASEAREGDKRLSKSGVLLEQVEGNPDFILFCQILNSVLALVRPKHFQHNYLAFYHYAWLAVLDLPSPMPDWGDAVEKMVTQQVKGLGVCNEPTCLGPYHVHLYLHFNKLHNEKMEGPNKRKAHKQTITDSNTKTEEEIKAKSESQNATWIGEASGSKLQDTMITTMEFKEWGILLQNLGRNTSRLF
ncbi:hypothetical protein R1flu_000944 [Riccia fluitans]|uniref:Uncharacterized protein n=1 Tax=Riccia fluitans TaxID=41844 RepID=A0ABD1Y2V5_9MARC